MEEAIEEIKIHTYPDPVLRERAELIENIDEGAQLLIDRMLERMYGAPGIGLAANQVGELRRLIVFDLHPEKPEPHPYALINPEIILREGEVCREEACLSVLDYSAEITRNSEVKVRGLDRNQKPVEIEAEGLLAICLQHEIDHLNGLLFIDHISRLKKTLYKKKLQKKLKSE